MVPAQVRTVPVPGRTDAHIWAGPRDRGWMGILSFGNSLASCHPLSTNCCASTAGAGPYPCTDADPCPVERCHRVAPPHGSETEALACAEMAIPELVSWYDQRKRRQAERNRERAAMITARRATRLGPGWDRMRRQVLAEEPACPICWAPAEEVDHIVPLARGGDSSRPNLQALCRACHEGKTRKDGSLQRPLSPPAPWIGLADIARRLGVRHTTARQWVRAGRLPPSESVPGFRGEWWRWPDIEQWARETQRL